MFFPALHRQITQNCGIKLSIFLIGGVILIRSRTTVLPEIATLQCNIFFRDCSRHCIICTAKIIWNMCAFRCIVVAATLRLHLFFTLHHTKLSEKDIILQCMTLQLHEQRFSDFDSNINNDWELNRCNGMQNITS